MPRSLGWIGIGLISTTLSSCGVLRSQLGLDPSAPSKDPPVVSDQPRTAPLQPGDNVIVKAVDRVGPAVVRIDVVKEINNPLGRMFGLGPATQRQQGQGSGFITRANGLIFTNEHVVRGADKVAVTLPDGRSFTGKELEGQPHGCRGCESGGGELTGGNTGRFQQVEAWRVGHCYRQPFGLNNTVTAGIIGAVGRTQANNGGGQRVPYIQTDAAVNLGNSGGPLINAAGQVIGMNTFIRQAPGGGLSFAIPINSAKRIAQQIVSTGQASHPYLGVRLRDLTPQLAREINATNPQCKVPEANGVLVVDVEADSPAAAADIRQCDLIRQVNGKKVRNPSEVQIAVDQGQVGEPMQVTLERDGAELTVEVLPIEIPRSD